MKIESIQVRGSKETGYLNVSRGVARLTTIPIVGQTPKFHKETINPDGSDVAQIAANFVTVLGSSDRKIQYYQEIRNEVHMIETLIRMLYLSSKGKEIGNYDFTPDDK